MSAIESSIVPFPEFVCPMTTSYTVKAGDSGDKIAKQLFPEDDVEVAWANIVTCNHQLRVLYMAHDGDKTALRFDTVEGMKLVIPDKQAILQETVLGNLTVEELISIDSRLSSSFEGLTVEDFMSITDGLLYKLEPSLEGLSAEELTSSIKEVIEGNMGSLLSSSDEGDDENSGRKRRKLMTEGSVQSFSPMPGKRPGDWDLYQCVPMFSRDARSKITIFRYGNHNCQAYWDKLQDGCSSPVWSAYLWAHTPACVRHDACKLLLSICTGDVDICITDTTSYSTVANF